MAWISAALIVWALTLAAVDFRVRRIPNAAIAAILLMIGGSFAMNGVGPLGASSADALLGATLPLVFMLPGYARGLLGAGDVKLAFAMGLLVGPLPMLLLLLIAGALLGITAIAARAHASRVTHLPAAPMLAAGFTTVLSLAAIA